MEDVQQDRQALAEAVKKQRKALGISSHKEASEKSKRYDLECYPDKAGAYPGISTGYWSRLERGETGELRPHTLRLVDAVMRWPEGTARSIAEGGEAPTGAPVELPSEKNGHNGGDEVEVRVDVSRALAELDGLWRRQLDAEDRIKGVEDAVGEVKDTLQVILDRLQ